MPFTPAHTAIVLPFLKSKRFSATGLIIGSMAPDFEYFFKMSVGTRMSHTYLGLFYFDIPVTLLMALIFHKVIRDPLIDNLPGFLQQRLTLLRSADFVKYLRSHLLVVAYSAVVASFSHIVWDSFTHGDGYFVSELDFIYQGRIVPFDGARYPLWYVLQHVSTWVGLAAFAGYVLAIKPVSIQTQRPQLGYWLGVVVFSAMIFFARFGFKIAGISFGNQIVTAISALSLAVIIMGVLSKRVGTTRNHG